MNLLSLYPTQALTVGEKKQVLRGAIGRRRLNRHIRRTNRRTDGIAEQSVEVASGLNLFHKTGIFFTLVLNYGFNFDKGK